MKVFKLCLICKTKIYKAKLGYGITRWKKVKYCSHKCLTESQRKKKHIVKCAYCGKEKQIYPYELKDRVLHFCNQSCKQKHKQSKNLYKANPKPFKKGFKPWNKNKKNCFNEKTILKISNSKKGKLVGKDNPSYKHGLCKTNLHWLIRKNGQYKNWVKSIFKRDDYVCRKCEKKGGSLTAHHLKGFSYLLHFYKIKNLEDAIKCQELWNINNGITLCLECHKQTPNYSFKANNNPIDNNKY